VTDVRGWLYSWRPGHGRRTLQRALLAWLCLAHGCLVTDDVNYDRPNSAPQLTKREPLDFSAVLSMGNCMNGARPGMQFRVDVYDADVEDQVFLRVLVNEVKEANVEVASNGQAMRPPHPELCIPISALEQNCSHVEILASSGFRDIDGDQDPTGTKREHDLARVEWYLLGPATTHAEVGVSECQKKPPEGDVQ
jgi:hypothetical protein